MLAVTAIALMQAGSGMDHSPAVFLAELGRQVSPAYRGQHRVRSWPYIPANAVGDSELLQSIVEARDEGTFHCTFRMSVAEFERLHEDLELDGTDLARGQNGPALQRRKGARKLSSQVMLALFLHRMAHGTTYNQLQLLTGSGRATVVRSFKLVLACIVEKRVAIDIAWPDAAEKAAHKAAMVAKYGEMFNGCIGMIDGSEITINKPTRGQRAWYSGRYSHHCVKVQAVSSHDEYFYHIVAGVRGSVHDSTIFKESDLHLLSERYFQEDEYLIGDVGYPQTLPYIATPYKPCYIGADEQWKVAFNDEVASARVRVEHCFGRIKGQWRILQSAGGRFDVPQSQYNMYLLAVFILHNRAVLKKRADAAV